MHKLTKEEILAKAKSILKLDEKEHIETCLKAGICPECGEPLKSEVVRTLMSIGTKYYHCDFKQHVMRTRPSLT